MTSAASESQKLTHDIKIRLLTITHASGTLTYTNNILDSATAVVFGSVTYFGRKFKLKGFQVKSGGSLPRPTLKVDNTPESGDVNGPFWFLLNAHDNFLDATVNYKEVYRENLDDGSDPDTTQVLVDLNYVIRQVKRLHRLEAEFQLATPLDLEQYQFGRQLLRNTCGRDYRVADPNTVDTFFQPAFPPGCPWGDLTARPGTGTPFFKKDGTITSDWREDDCGMLHQDCERRFHNTDTNVKLPFWGAPSIGSK